MYNIGYKIHNKGTINEKFKTKKEAVAKIEEIISKEDLDGYPEMWLDHKMYIKYYIRISKNTWVREN